MQGASRRQCCKLSSCPPHSRSSRFPARTGRAVGLSSLASFRPSQPIFKMASSTLKQVALAATKTLSQQGAPLASRQRAVFASSSRSLISARRAASSQATQIEMTTQADAPQIVPTAEEMTKDPQLAGLGYPQLPNVSRQTRPALANWWDRQERWAYSYCKYTANEESSVY